MGVSIIHFSDIHIVSEKDSIFSKKEELINACVNNISNKDNVIIVISGDIAFSGMENQYGLAKKLLEEIVERLKIKGINNIEILCVPGNHDCDFSTESTVRDLLLSNVTVDKVNQEVYGALSEIQRNYFSFSDSLNLSKDMIQLKEVCFDNVKYGFLLINTAWMSQLHEKYGEIIIPSSFFKQVDLSEYKVVFSVFHHPSNWLSDSCRNDFVEYIHANCDIILVGHEHYRSEYYIDAPELSLHCYKAKELQNSDNTEDSGFNILTFATDTKEVLLNEINWNSLTYTVTKRKMDYSKNKAMEKSSFIPNEAAREWLLDVGFTVNHFAKEEVSLRDVFVCPDIKRNIHYSERTSSERLRTGALEEMIENPVSIVYGASLSGKTSIAKILYMQWVEDKKTCLYMTGSEFKNSSREGILKVIDKFFVEQYSLDMLDEFRNLAKEKKCIIIDEFDAVAMVGNRRSEIIDVLTDIFENVVIIVSSEIEMTSFMMADAVTKLDKILSYEVLPFGNTKRKELVYRWYHLANSEHTEEELESRVDKGIEVLNKFLGNGAGFVPAYPIYLIGALQNVDATQTNNSSKYGYLYETMIQKSLSKISGEYKEPGAYNIDIELVSSIAFYMLGSKKSYVSGSEIDELTNKFNVDKKLRISSSALLTRMKTANVFVSEASEGTDTYKFKYPYIFYFFAGRYIAYNLNDVRVKNSIETMSSKLYIEAYGNIMIFVCHFANHTEVIETILLNAYDTLGKYPEFVFFEKTPGDNQLIETISLLEKETVSNNEDVQINKEKRLERLDNMGINDGTVSHDVTEIVEMDADATELEKDLAAISAALKTMEVLGQIIQNYPGGIDGELKTEIIREIYKLGMRSVEAISENMENLQDELAKFVYERAQFEKKGISKEQCKEIAKRITNMLTLGMVRGMISKIAVSINSKHLDVAAKEVLTEETSCFAKLVLVDLQLNCFKSASYEMLERTKKSLEEEKTVSARIATGVLRQIVVNYLDYNKCDFKLRQRICDLFKLSPKHKIPVLETNLLSKH